MLLLILFITFLLQSLALSQIPNLVALLQSTIAARDVTPLRGSVTVRTFPSRFHPLQKLT